MNDDLIERLKCLDNSVLMTPEGEIHIKEIITALSAPLPEEVQNVLKELTLTGLSPLPDPLYQKAHNLIERLAHDGYIRKTKIKLLHQRIEELEQQLEQLKC